ncbi:helix-turn-helix domain-containing protein [Chryseobacterium sp. G0201]|uniref:AlbA family DNA-binding domain-containing protein n=1 Tax=Chryseobacterium sp. G0201 TaxID=2487065 RepID=UPI001E2991F2|nr:ATP-binding protein [Chryseobacterium sp. G0201]
MWTLEKINQFIKDCIEENIHLDYKGAGSISKVNEKKKEISKDVSAFANSDGGTIIYGVREFDEMGKTHRKD